MPGAKRKKPPTFQHLPEHRGANAVLVQCNVTYARFILAKSLKKAWVEKTKIKSQWKAQKRKEDLASRTKLELPVYEDESRHDTGAGSNDEEEAGPSSKNASGKAPYVHPSRSHIHPDEPVDQSKSAPPRKKPRDNETEGDARPLKKRKTSAEAGPVEAKPDAAQSLRELKREAYSTSTLHTFKADPLKKNKHQTSAPRGRGAAAVSRGGRAGTGRGQPNMKLRMNAMLAEIKQSFA